MSFGVTPADVQAYCNGLFFRDAAVGPPVIAATQPSLAQCTAYIVGATSRVNGWLRGVGIEPSSITLANTADTYAICAELVVLDTAAWAIASRSRADIGLATEYRRQYDAALARLAKAKQYIGSGRNVSDNGPSLPQGTSPPSGPRLPRTQGSSFWDRSNGQL
jgi:hypothetical protein